MKLKTIILCIGLFVLNKVHAQTNFTGIWQGTLKVAGELELILHIAQLPDESYVATFDSPDQNTRGIKCDTVITKSTSFLDDATIGAIIPPSLWPSKPIFLSFT